MFSCTCAVKVIKAFDVAALAHAFITRLRFLKSVVIDAIFSINFGSFGEAVYNEFFIAISKHEFQREFIRENNVIKCTV